MARVDYSELSGQSIALIGMMGVGKTTVGRRLAKKLDLPFYDADEEIEKASGRTIKGYFRDHGEAAFRVGECKVIERLLDGPPILLATGGGAFVQKETRKILQSKAVTIWLKADLKVIYGRVKRNTKRPLLNVDDPETVLKEMIDTRYPIYGHADITINSNRGPHTRSVEAAIRGLRAYYKAHEDSTHMADKAKTVVKAP